MRSNTRSRKDRADEASDDSLTWLSAVLADLTAHATSPDRASAGERLGRIATLEQFKGAAAAAQHTLMVALVRSQLEKHLAHVDAGGFDPAPVVRGIDEQMHLAKQSRTSPPGQGRISPRTGRTR